jgi:hypothetical protein
MLLLLVLLAAVSAAILLIRYLKRQDVRSLEANSNYDLPAENFRPLFAPTDDDLRAFEKEEAANAAADERRAIERIDAERETDVRRLHVAWRAMPSRQNTVDLLVAAAHTGDADLFSDVSRELLKVFGETGIGGLSPMDMAELLNSHYRLLPQAERSSGALFWLKQEIAELNSEVRT